jgi:peptidoglycan/LPS O-acetylase OafA/YrhL
MFNNFYHNHVDILSSFLLLPQDYTPLLSVAWTLIHEVYFYLIVSFALMFSVRGRWLFGGIWFSTVLTVFLFFGGGEFHHIRILQLVFSPFSLTFLLGYFIGLWFDQIRKIPLSLALGLFFGGMTGLALGMAVFWSYLFGVYPENNNLFRFVGCGLPVALLIASAIAMESRWPEFVLRLDVLGDISYANYLVHMPYMTVFYLMLSKLPLNSPVLVAAAAAVFLVSCLMLAAVFHFYLEIRLTLKCRKMLEHVFRLQERV